MLSQNASNIVGIALHSFLHEAGRVQPGVLRAQQQLHQVQEVSQWICNA